MEPDIYQAEESPLTFHQHVAEFFHRLINIGVGSLFCGLLGFLLSGQFVHVLYRILDFGAAASRVNTELDLTAKILWGAVITVVTFHHFLVNNLYGYVAPGLYPHERRMFLIPRVWAKLTPITSLFFVFTYAVIINKLGSSTLLEPDNIRAWFIRFFLITTLSTFLIALPRQKRILSYYAYSCLIILIWVLPNHVFDTLIILLTELCVVLSVATVIALWGWAACESEINRIPF